MSKYIIGSVDLKTTKDGKQYKKINVKDEAGVITKEVSIWPDCSQYNAAILGATIEGVLSNTGKYTNFKDGNLGTRPAGIGYGKSAVMEKAMDRKEASIDKSQDRKEYGIMVSSTAGQATEILTANIRSNPMPPEDWKKEWLKIRHWLVQNWNNTETRKVGSTGIDYPEQDASNTPNFDIDEFNSNEQVF